jgi:two-component system C4-dicarboxylate transport sensor histidine kinase DctB
MKPAARTRIGDARLVLYVALGTLTGAGYVVFDVLSESRLESGTLTGALAGAHAVIDRSLPVLVGALLGVCLHYLQLRGRLAAAEETASRAEALRERLQKVERDQAVWVLAAAVLHELNNPLHALCLLLDELGNANDAQRADLVARARAQAERATARLALLRTMPTSGEPELRRIALDAIVAPLADDLRPLAAEDGLAVRMECAGPVHAIADPTYVRTILENLLDNCLHSLRTQGGSAVTVRLSAEGSRAVVRVCDDGPALQPSVRAALFEPLRTTKASGLGLGLPIARALARAMRGDLSFDDEGAKAFRLELPVGVES